MRTERGRLPDLTWGWMRSSWRTSKGTTGLLLLERIPFEKGTKTARVEEETCEPGCCCCCSSKTAAADKDSRTSCFVEPFEEKEREQERRREVSSFRFGPLFGRRLTRRPASGRGTWTSSCRSRGWNFLSKEKKNGYGWMDGKEEKEGEGDVRSTLGGNRKKFDRGVESLFSLGDSLDENSRDKKDRRISEGSADFV